MESMEMGYRGMEEVHNEVKDPQCDRQEDNIRSNIRYQGQGENGTKKNPWEVRASLFMWMFVLYVCRISLWVPIPRFAYAENKKCFYPKSNSLGRNSYLYNLFKTCNNCSLLAQW